MIFVWRNTDTLHHWLMETVVTEGAEGGALWFASHHRTYIAGCAECLYHTDELTHGKFNSLDITVKSSGILSKSVALV